MKQLGNYRVKSYDEDTARKPQKIHNLEFKSNEQ